MKGWMLLGLRVYKRNLSPWLPRACRFTPTCSEYAALAIEHRGVVRGGLGAMGRVLRCQPLHPGGIDIPSARGTERLPSAPDR